MPQWRKLHLKTVESLDINDMPDDFTRLMWVLLPLGLDSEGRGLDNPAWIKSRIFPVRTDVSLAMIEQAIMWYENRQMVQRYQVDGRQYFCLPTFHKYQGKTDREAESQYPAPPQEGGDDNENLLKSNSRVTQELVPSKSSSDVDSDIDIDSIPNGIGDQSPELEKSDGPRKQLMGIFNTETGIKMPFRKTDVKFWWSSIGELYKMVDYDVSLGEYLIKESVKRMREKRLDITSPNSILGYCRSILAEHNGAKPKVVIGAI